MSCDSWPSCTMSMRCARCWVIDQCQEQVPASPDSRISTVEQSVWRGFHVYPVPPPGLTYRARCALGVADRLIEWLAWPGVELHDYTDNGEPWRGHHHPLDRTPAAKLRMLAVFGQCFGCDGTGANVHGCMHHPDDPAHDDRCEDCENCEGSGVVRVTHWPTIAIICDELDRAGMWGDVHAWRPVFAQIKRGLAYVSRLQRDLRPSVGLLNDDT